MAEIQEIISNSFAKVIEAFSRQIIVKATAENIGLDIN